MTSSEISYKLTKPFYNNFNCVKCEYFLDDELTYSVGCIKNIIALPRIIGCEKFEEKENEYR